jgi:DtxR family Mn-dependent transcriptional regulator
LASSTVEDYLKQIYLEQQATGAGQLVSMGRLATAMGVVPGTATTMIKALADSGLVSYEPRGGARLTRGGEQLALHVLRRHRLVELFLVKVLKLDWSEVHAEAEELEHAISEKVLEKIDALLDRPSVDPHGDPIPPAKGKLLGSRHFSLLECEIDRPMRVARVLDQNPAFLQFLDRCGLTPGTAITVESREEAAAAVKVKPERKQTVTLGFDAAAKILVET